MTPPAPQLTHRIAEMVAQHTRTLDSLRRCRKAFRICYSWLSSRILTSEVARVVGDKTLQYRDAAAVPDAPMALPCCRMMDGCHRRRSVAFTVAWGDGRHRRWPRRWCCHGGRRWVNALLSHFYPAGGRNRKSGFAVHFISS